MQSADDPPHGLPRRELLRRALGGAALVGVVGSGCTTPEPTPGPAPGPAPAAPPGHASAPGASSWDFVQGSAALEPERTVTSVCQFCNSACRIHVGVKAGRALSVRGEADDPVQAGRLCVKAELMAELAHNGRRLTRPLKRVGGAKGSPGSRFEPISWDEALATIARKFIELRDQGEARAIANRTCGRLQRGVGSLAGRLFTMLGSPNDTDVGPVCNDAGGNALAWTFGMGNFTNGYGIDGATGAEDLGSAKYLLFLGTNQAETHPVTFEHLLRCRERTGAKLIVVDPRRTATGALADTWVPIKPHTDLALVLGMLGHVVKAGLVDRAFVEGWTVGFDDLARHLEQQGYGPEWAAGRCDVPASTIRELAEGYARSRPAAIFCNAGISHQLNAFATYRALALLASVTGNVGRPGGGCNFMHNTWPGGLNLPPLPAGFQAPAKGPALPVGPDAFADSILDARPYRLRALVVEGNPLLSSANSARVRRAYESLELFVYTGLFMEESAWFADVILPVCSGLELEGVYMRRDDRAIRWQERAVARVGEARPDAELWIDLAHAIAAVDAPRADAWRAAFPPAWKDYATLWSEFVRLTPGMGGMTVERLKARKEPLRWPCPSTQHPGVSTLYLDDPSWYAAAESLGHRGKRFLTPSGKVELFTADMASRLAAAGHSALPVYFTHPEVTGRHERLVHEAELVTNPVNPQALTPKVHVTPPTPSAAPAEFPLMGMVGRSSVAHFAGVTHWTPTGKRLNGVRLVQLHPATARRAGVSDGDDVVVASPRGSVRGTALLWEGIREDTVFVPNGFGWAQSVGDDAAAPRYADAANALLDDHAFDTLSGQQAYKCFACRVAKA